MKRSYTITFILFCSITVDNIGRVGSCITSSGPSRGCACIFPFKYKGKEYKGCTIIDSGSLIPWCPTSTSSNGVFVRGRNNWGNCDLNSCPFDFDGTTESRASTAPPFVRPNNNSPNNGGGGFDQSFGSFFLPNAGGLPPGSNAPPGSSGINPLPPPFVQSSTKPSCGVSEVQVTTRIVNGQASAPNQWPWMVAILRANSLKYLCGGALISDQHVLTAAHCVNLHTKSQLIIRLGDYDLSKVGETDDVTLEIDLIKYHGSFNTIHNNYDIAIIKLKRKVQFSKSIYPVCLPSSQKSYADTIGIAIGWGSTRFVVRSNILRHVNVRIWKQEPCKRNYGDVLEVITPQMLCAGNNGRDSCGGDSGGPLICKNEDNIWELCGIVSFGSKNCGSATLPGVYTRITEFLPWILLNM